ncbi:MAG: hypothetical protein DCF15_08505 [Phormidesmis priestleyi]|uniref:Uncharacterized protein n=1 Tax=Phormidesmis priestleyi TaxID=268141 RepID=A0A2W4ZCV8_9CYAN|nr:MAG: hypothetical protein DCF15_08505 [Phormidesmis priestleyi]
MLSDLKLLSFLNRKQFLPLITVTKHTEIKTEIKPVETHLSINQEKYQSKTIKKRRWSNLMTTGAFYSSKTCSQQT